MGQCPRALLANKSMGAQRKKDKPVAKPAANPTKPKLAARHQARVRAVREDLALGREEMEKLHTALMGTDDAMTSTDLLARMCHGAPPTQGVSHSHGLLVVTLVVCLLVQHVHIYRANLDNYNMPCLVLLIAVVTRKVWAQPSLMLHHPSKTVAAASSVMMAAGVVVCWYCGSQLQRTSLGTAVLLLPVCVRLGLYWSGLTARGRAESGEWLFCEFRLLLWEAVEGPFYATVVPLHFIQNEHLLYDAGHCYLTMLVAVVLTAVLLLLRPVCEHTLLYFLQCLRIASFRRRESVGDANGSDERAGDGGRVRSGSRESASHHHRDGKAAKDGGGSAAAAAPDVGGNRDGDSERDGDGARDADGARGGDERTRGRSLVGSVVGLPSASLTTLFLWVFCDPWKTHWALAGACAATSATMLVMVAWSMRWACYFSLLAAANLVLHLCLLERRRMSHPPSLLSQASPFKLPDK